MRRAAAVSLALLVSLTVAGRATGEGLFLAPGDLAPKARAELVQAVVIGRRVEPGAFEAVAALRERVEEAAQGQGKRVPSVLRELLGLGGAAVPAILSELAVDGARRPMSERGRGQWTRDLLDGLAVLRVPVSVAVLEELVARRAEGFLVVRASAAALSVHDTERTARVLVAASQRGSVRRRLAVLAGMGACRRRVVAERLFLALAAARGRSDERIAIQHLARALGTLGDASAWDALSSERRTDEGAIRGGAAHALVLAFAVEEDPVTRRALTQALLLVDEVSTGQLVRTERDAADPTRRERLDELSRRVQRNPLR